MKINFIEYLRETVNKFPNKIAIDDNQATISFSELEKITNNLTAAIISKIKILRQPIAVYLPKNRWCILSYISIFKSGNFYIPLDIKSPMERVSKILNNVNPKFIITDAAHKEKLISEGYTGEIILIEDAINTTLTEETIVEVNEISEKIIDSDPLYAIYTSGSTGNPKGVLMSHKGVIDYVEWAIETYSINEKEVIGNQGPFYFDITTLDIYFMVVKGATLNIIPEGLFSFPTKLIEYVNSKKINFIFWVPSVLKSISNFDTFSHIKPTSLNKILFSGEVMPNKHLNYWRKNYPKALYSNLYGPTEITAVCTYYIVNRAFKDDESLPIGKACKNTQVLIISENGKHAINGEIGELCVRGTCLAYGYINDSETTNLAFVQNPLHSLYPDLVYKTGDLVYKNALDEIIFVGRKDSQIKHLGNRIEPGEIETAILGIEGVSNVCVIYDDLKKQIVAFFIANKKGLEIRKELISSLPKYMIPTIWIEKENFPLNANGKINRLELKEQLS